MSTCQGCKHAVWHSRRPAPGKFCALLKCFVQNGWTCREWEPKP